MGFSIGRLLGAVAPIIGGAVFGPVGAAVGGAIGAGFAPKAPTVQARVAPTSTVPTTAAAFRPGQVIGPFSGIASLFAGGNGRTLKEILAEAREFRPGATRNKIIAAAKACGIDLAADTFGLSTSDICAVVILGATRRRRGVSSANIRTTKRVIRFASGLRKDLKAIK